MRICVTDIIKSYDGKPVQENQEQDGKIVKIDITVRDVFNVALNNMAPGEIMTIDDKNKAYNISRKLFAKKEVDFTVKELGFIEERTGKYYNNPLLVGRCSDLLNGRSFEPDLEEETAEVRAKGEK